MSREHFSVRRQGSCKSPQSEKRKQTALTGYITEQESNEETSFQWPKLQQLKKTNKEDSTLNVNILVHTNQ